MNSLHKPMHPSEALKELYLTPLEMSAIALAKLLVVRRTRTEHLVKGEVRIIPNTAWHLTKAFGATPVCCMNMQVDHDLVEVREATDLFGIEPLVAA